jgi:DNA-binding helix-hairpin-helix protein with protein kinase domain
LLGRLRVATRLARAIRRMHFAGLAHSDLSNKNVLIDPKGGDACVIDIDSLVVPGIAPPSVLGTPGYIAPEVLAGKAQPSIATDKHALAVLLYQLLLQRHPLQGTRVNSARSPEEDEMLSMGARALFVEHPTDRSNPPSKPIQVPYHRLGPHLAPLFEKSFVHGLHAPDRRPDAAEWEAALYRTLHMLAPTSSGRHWVVAGPGLPTTCPWSNERIGSPLPYARVLKQTSNGVGDEGITFSLFHHLVLHEWHRRSGVTPNESADRTPQGYVAQDGGKWWLVNTSHEPMHVVDGEEIGHNGKVELVPGLALRGSGDVPGRILQVDFLR